MSKHRQVVLLLALLLSSWAASVELWAQEQSAFLEALEKGESLVGRGLYSAAHRQFTKADEMTDLFGLVEPPELVEAESIFRKVLEHDGVEASVASYYLAVVLARQERHVEARATLRAYSRPSDSACMHWTKVMALSRSREDSEVSNMEEPAGRIPKFKPPRKISAPQPQYPAIARKARIQGLVILDSVLNEQGNITKVKLLKGLPMGLDQAAIDAFKTWKFKPATSGGEPISVYYTTCVNFQLRK